ncbi:MAG TPA: TlpA disulfide reductase family protein [Phnomibacter sp.]|nr:TlpA disulfide reductase family protein [Phnomibacter sp.]
MNKILVALATITLLVACKSKDATNLEGGTVKLKGSIKGVDTGWMELIVPSRENQKIDSIKIEKAGFNYTLKVKEPELLVLRIAGTQQSELAFWGEPGTVAITANKDSFWTSKVDGGPTQVLYKDLEAKVKSIMVKGQALQPAYMAAQQTQNMEEMQRIEAQMIALQEETKTTAIDFAKKNKGTVLSAYIGLVFLAQPGNDAAIKNLYDSLPPAVQKTFFGKKMAEFVNAAAATAVGAAAPEFMMNDVNDKPVSLSSFKGQIVLIDFWASWCGPCRQENPNVVKAYEAYKDKGFTILGVSLDQDKAAWLKAIADDKLSWTQVSDLQYWNNAAAKLYKVQSIPANFLLDKDGKIIARDLRGPALEAKLAEVLK